MRRSYDHAVDACEHRACGLRQIGAGIGVGVDGRQSAGAGNERRPATTGAASGAPERKAPRNSAAITPPNRQDRRRQFLPSVSFNVGTGR